jgi:small, acid-soluble spore protein C
MNNSSYSKNRLVVPGSENAISQMKYEIANELGVNLGPDATARQNGSVGGEITRRLVSMAQSNLQGK